MEAARLFESEVSKQDLIEHYFKKLSPCDQAHSLRVEALSLKIAHEISDEKINFSDLQLAARYHDIGKIKIPERILNKKGPLEPEERQRMMVHSKFSSQILENTGHSKSVIRYAMLHHENFDGSGYPFGLKGGQIPIEARIIRVADVFDALHTERPYKQSLPVDTCLEIISRELNAYDKELVSVLRKIIFLRNFT